MTDTVVDALILDLLEWLAFRDRSYEEVIDAWRTSCPKLPVWEEANDRGLVRREEVDGRIMVRVTARGHSLLQTTNREKVVTSTMPSAAELLQRLRELLRRRSGSPPASDDDGDVLVGAPLKPRPPLRSGAIALPLPDWDDR